MAGLFDLRGKVVLVTGGNSGLGLGFAQGCAKFGADIMIWGRNVEKNKQAEAALRELGAPRVFSESVDVRDEKAVEQGVANAVERAGRIDCAFVNAGTASMAPSFPDMTSEMWHDLLGTNLHGAFYTLRAVSRHMRSRAQAGDLGGSIVICGSISIFGGRQGLEHYAAAKGALAVVMKGMATELAQYRVRVNMIAPGAIRTGMSDIPNREEMEKQVAAITPLGRIGQKEDIEGLAVYFASDASSFHTGDITVLDGGRVAKSS